MEKATPKVLHEISMRVNLKAGKKYAKVLYLFTANIEKFDLDGFIA